MAGRDAEVIQAVLRGHVERYAELVEWYHDQAIRVAFGFLGNYEDAKDVSQAAFLRAYQSLGRFRHTSKFSTWLYRIVINECKDTFKRRARQPLAVARVGEGDDGDEGSLFVDVADPGADPADRASGRELSAQLSRAIGRLPMKQRTAFLLHHVHGHSLQEAAAVMGCRLGTVKAHVFRATASLRKQLGPWLTQERL